MSNTTIPCASLYVGDLHADVTEAVLYEKFQTHGKIISIRVCRDLVTRKSLGYAYVNYQASAEAKSAMDNLNLQDIHGRPCRIMRSQRDPAARQSGVGNIFIKNLDPTITVKEINDTFAKFGEISSCKLQTDDDGVSKGFAFVNFTREDDAEKAIQAMNGKTFRDKIVYVAKFVPRTQRNTHNKNYINCDVKYFGANFTDKSLKEFFEPCGKIVSAKVMVDKDGNSKGLGFVRFREHRGAIKAVHGEVIDEKPIYVDRAMKKAERQRELPVQFENTRQERLQKHKYCVHLYIKNLGNDVNDDRLRAEFDIFGKITSAKVMLNKENNTSKGFGFVCFSTSEEATRAVIEMNGKIVDGKGLYVALAQTKEDRLAYLRSQFQKRVHQPQPVVFNEGMMNLNFQSRFIAGPGNIIHDTWPPGFPCMSSQNLKMNRSRFIAGPGNIIHDTWSPGFPCMSSQNLIMNRSKFMARPGNILQNRWPPNVPYMTTRNNIVGMPVNQNLMMTGLPQQNQRRNILVDPMMNQNRNARPITGNVQINLPGIESNISRIDLSTTSKITNVDYMNDKQLLGEKIYPMVSKIAGDMAGKITGMILELDNGELLHMIENENSLRIKIDEALLVLNAHKRAEGNINKRTDQHLIQDKNPCKNISSGLINTNKEVVNATNYLRTNKK